MKKELPTFYIVANTYKPKKLQYFCLKISKYFQMPFPKTIFGKHVIGFVHQERF